MENKNYLHFSGGMGLPRLLGELAQEKLLHALDPQGAIEFFKKALIGCNDENICIELLSGRDYCLSIDVDSQTLFYKKRNENDLDYPILNSGNIINGWIATGLNDCSEIKHILGLPDYRKCVGDKTFTISVTLGLKEFLGIVQGRVEETSDILYKTLIDTYYDREDEYFNSMIEFSNLILLCKDWILGISKKVEVINFIMSNNLGIGLDKISSDYLTLRLRIGEIYSNLIKLLGLVELDELSELYRKELQPLLRKDPEISSRIDRKIFPVDITDGYDAGWLSPNGEFYGMRGETSELLHIQIANLLYEDGIIPVDEKGNFSWLEFNGWVKIHHSWILWESDDILNGGYVIRDLTEEQIRSIVNYGNRLYSGILTFGYKHKKLTMGMFKAMDSFAKKRLFSVYSDIEGD